MVQFMSIIFFSWISSIFVGFFKSSRFFCVTLYFWAHKESFVLQICLYASIVLSELVRDVCAITLRRHVTGSSVVPTCY